jgi:hypothetical protein
MKVNELYQPELNLPLWMSSKPRVSDIMEILLV